MKPDKSTPVTVRIKGRDNADYALGLHADAYHGFVWGLVDRFGWMTQMRYGGDYAVPSEMVDRGDDVRPFCFDMGADITMTQGEMKRAFTELGLI